MKKIIIDFYEKYKDLDDNISSCKISQDKWSLKEIIGHLIDSSSNNHQRFIRFQLDEELNFPDYSREDWLQVVDYNSFDFYELISLLYYNTLFLDHIIKKADKKSLGKKWPVRWSDTKNFITFGELIHHYNEHLEGHLRAPLKTIFFTNFDSNKLLVDYKVLVRLIIIVYI